VARSGLGRFAAFGPPTRIFIENAKKRQGAHCAACPFDCAGEICKPRSGVKSSPQLLSLYAQNGCAFERRLSLYAQNGCAFAPVEDH